MIGQFASQRNLEQRNILGGKSRTEFRIQGQLKLDGRYSQNGEDVLLFIRLFLALLLSEETCLQKRESEGEVKDSTLLRECESWFHTPIHTRECERCI